MNKKDIRIVTAAYLFSKGKTAEEIAELIDTSQRTVCRYVETSLWETVLNTLEFTGNRSFPKQPRRDIERESGDQIEYTHEVYTQIIKEGINPRNAARLTSERTGLPISRVRQWERRFAWRETD